MQNIYRSAGIPAHPESFTREIGAVMNNFPAAWAQCHSLTLPTRPRCKPSAGSCASRDKSSSNHCAGVWGHAEASKGQNKANETFLRPRLGAWFPCAVSTGQAGCMAAVALCGWNGSSRDVSPSPQLWEGWKNPWLCLCTVLPSLRFCLCGVGAGGDGIGGGGRAPQRGALHHHPPGWAGSGEMHIKLSPIMPRFWKGRNLLSAHNPALKPCKKSPPNLNPKELLSP